MFAVTIRMYGANFTLSRAAWEAILIDTIPGSYLAERIKANIG